MAQLSFLSVEARDTEVGDLAGLLCGPGQIVRFGSSETARLSIVLVDPARVPALTAACAARGVQSEVGCTESGATVLRTSFRGDLARLAAAWTRGAVKSVPADFELDGPTLRLWAAAAGRMDGRGGFLLALDPHAPGTHASLAGAATRTGLRANRVTPRGGGPSLRITGQRRMQRLATLVGPPPDAVAAAQWPSARP